MQRSTCPIYTISVLTLTAIVSTSLSGCRGKTAAAEGNGVIGVWTSTVPGAGGQSASLIAEYQPDGTALRDISSPGHTMEIRSKFAVKDGTLSETFVSATMNSKPTDVPSLAGRTLSYTYKIDGKTMTLTRDGATPMVLTRSD